MKQLVALMFVVAVLAFPCLASNASPSDTSRSFACYMDKLVEPSNDFSGGMSALVADTCTECAAGSYVVYNECLNAHPGQDAPAPM